MIRVAVRILAGLLALSLLPLWVMMIIVLLQAVGYGFEIVLFAGATQIGGIILFIKLMSFAFGAKK